MSKTKITAEPGKQEFLVTREFDAPRELVFKAHTDPKLYTQWLGPRRLTMRLEKFEPRSGGMWRYIHKDKDGTEYGFHGVIHEVLPPERIIDTFEFEGLPEKGLGPLQRLRWQELPGGRTKQIAQPASHSVAAPDERIKSAAKEGITESSER